MQAGQMFLAVFVSIFILGIFTFLVFMAGLALTAPLKLSRRAKVFLAGLALLNLVMQVVLADLAVTMAHLDQAGQSDPASKIIQPIVVCVFTFPIGLVPGAYRIAEPVFFFLNATVWSALVMYLYAGLQRLRGKPAQQRRQS